MRLALLHDLTRQTAGLEVATGLGGLAVAAVGAPLVLQGWIAPTLLPLLVLVSIAAFLPVSEIAQVGRQLADTIASTRRLHVVHSEPVLITDGPCEPAAPRGGSTVRFEQSASPIPAGTVPRWRMSTSRAGRAQRWRWSDRPAPARPPSPTCCCASGIPSRARSAGRGRSARADAGRAARPHRAGGAGHLPVQRHAGGECPACQAGCDAGGDRGRAATARRWPSSSPICRRGCDPRRRARRAAFRRPAPADRDRARVPEGRADPGAGRSDLASRHDQRAAGAVGARRADGGPHDDRGGAPAVHHPGRRCHPGAECRTGDRGRHARRASARRGFYARLVEHQMAGVAERQAAN